jgi:HEAT repeat protein
MSHLVVLALSLEGGLAVAAAAWLRGAAAWRRRRAARLRPRLDAARTALARGEDAAGPLSALSIEDRAGVVADVGAALRRTIDEPTLHALAVRRCASRLWWRRLRSVRLLALLGDGREQVPARLSDSNADVRAAAARWAADHPEADPGRLLAMLDDDRALPRWAAADALLRLGPAAVEPIAAYLDAAPSGRGLEGAMRVSAGVADPRLLAPVLARADDPSPRVRELAADVAGGVGGHDAVHALTGLLDDEDAQVRAAAAHALGRLKHWRSAPRLAAALRDPAWDVRRRSGLALLAMGSPGVLALRGALDDSDRFARDMARQLLDLPGAAVAS